MLSLLPAVILLAAPAHALHEEPAVRLFFVQPMMSAVLKDQDTGYELKLRANTPMSLGARASYAGYGLSFAHVVGGPVKDPGDFGHTQVTDLQIYSYKARYGIDAFYQSITGFYLDAPSQGGAGCLRGAACALRPDMGIVHMGLNAYYVWDPDFSLSAAFDQGARQLSGAGSFLILAGLNRASIDNPTPIAPPGADLGRDALFRGGTFYGLSVAPGYGYTFVYGGLFFSPVVFGGAGLQYRQDRAGAQRRGGLDVVIKVNVKASAGYNGARWMTGVVAQVDGPAFKLEQAEVQVMSGQVELFVGRRF